MERTPTNFFTQETEDAIIKYINSTDDVERNILYKKYIDKPINTLIDIYIHNLKAYYTDYSLEAIRSNTLNFLLDKLKNYKQENGKAYSYFSIVIRNFLIIQNRMAYKRHVKNNHKIESRATLEDEIIDENTTELDSFSIIYEYLNNNAEILFPKLDDLAIVYALLEVMKRTNKYEGINKRKIYLLIREQTDCNPQQITKIKKKLITIYKKVLDDHYRKMEE